MICASVVLPRPGGPTSRTWSSASPRAFAAASAIASCSLTPSWPTNSSSRRGPERALELLLVGAEHLRGDGAHAGRLPQRQPDALLGREVGIDRRQGLLGLEHGPAELDERIAGGQVHGGAGRARDRHGILGAELLLQLEHDPLGGLLADPGDRLEARRVLEHDRAAQVGGRRAGDDRERDLRPDPGHREQVQEELALGRLGEAVELQRVLADVQVGLDDDLAPALGGAHRAGRRREEIADAVDVEDEAVRRTPGELSPQAADHPPAIRSSGGASAWQIATARASAAWFGVGFASSARIERTIRCTCAFSARP